MKKLILFFIALLVGLSLFFFTQCQPVITTELDQESEACPLSTQGIIPSWLSGTLIRNGPVNVAVNGVSNAHWFDGLAMLHAFSFENGKVVYTNKFLRTDDYKTVFERGSIAYAGFAADPCRSLFKSYFTWFVPLPRNKLRNANVNVAKWADAYVALTETPLPVRFDPKTLETLGVFSYDDELPKERCWESAHPHNEINYLIEYGPTSTYTLYRLINGKRDVFARIPVREPAYMHSFAVTERYVILTAFPFVVNPLDLLTKGKPFIQNFQWKPERGTEFILVSRNTGEVVKRIVAKPFFAFHHANAYENGEEIILDAVIYDDPSIIANIHEDHPVRLERFTLSQGRVSSQTLLDAPVEFPRVNEAYDGKPYRYIYLADPAQALYKVDTLSGEVKLWSQNGCSVGEPVFAAASCPAEEDDGVVLSIVCSGENAFLLILDGKTFEEMGRAIVNHPIPPGLHAQYFQN